MLKGTTKIELTDVNTGKTEVIEKHNTITGALQELFNPVLGHLTNNTTLCNTLPAYASLLGGLLLFDGRIEGDPLPLYAPDSVKLVGCARYNTQNSKGGVYFGSYDATESSIAADTRTAKLVYNFTQSQANGTIGSVCLTHANGGYGVYRGDFSNKVVAQKLAVSIFNTPYIKLARDERDRSRSIYSYSTKEHLVAVDIDNDCAHYFRLTSATTIVMVKRRIGLKQFSMFGQTAAIIGEPVTINLSISLKDSSNYYSFDTETNTLYIFGQQSSQVAVNASFSVTAINLNSYAVTQKYLTNNHTKFLYAQGYGYRGRMYTLDGGTTATIDGKSATKYKVLSFDMSTGELATHGEVISPNSTVSHIPMYAADGRLYWQAGYDSSAPNMGGLWVTDCTATPDASNTTLCGIDGIDFYYGDVYYPVGCTPVLNHPMLMYLSQEQRGGTSYSQGFFILAHYLATINNLATPIVKAPTQTMKITYTIQEV